MEPWQICASDQITQVQVSACYFSKQTSADCHISIVSHENGLNPQGWYCETLLQISQRV